MKIAIFHDMFLIWGYNVIFLDNITRFSLKLTIYMTKHLLHILEYFL